MDEFMASGGGIYAGASMEEIMEVLKLCVLRVQACNLGIPILEEELARR